MDAQHKHIEEAEAHDLIALSAEAQIRRRRRSFWRRVGWPMVGVVVVVVVVFWQWGLSRREACRQALKRYARLAEEEDLGTLPPQLLYQQWRSLPLGSAHQPASHYLLVTGNWLLSPGAGEKLPLAVCREPHWVLFVRGRHVLYRTADGEHIEWVPEERVAAIVEEATKDALP